MILVKLSQSPQNKRKRKGKKTIQPHNCEYEQSACREEEVLGILGGTGRGFNKSIHTTCMKLSKDKLSKSAKQ